jgi:hypothetical protein
LNLSSAESSWDTRTRHGQNQQRYREQEDRDKPGELIGDLTDCGVGLKSKVSLEAVQTRKAAR